MSTIPTNVYSGVIVNTIIGPIILGSANATEEEPASSSRNGDKAHLARHKDEDQVLLDVGRSFIYYPMSKYNDCPQRKRIQLTSIEISQLRRLMV